MSDRLRLLLALAPLLACSGASADEQAMTAPAEASADASCDNGERDPNEADVDCGGSCEQPCEVDQSCSQNTDCESAQCSDENLCIPAGELVYADADRDGFGDPARSKPAAEANDTGSDTGWVANADDCDDRDPFTFLGAAIAEDPTACTKDADRDGWGDPAPTNTAVTPGLDCDDTVPAAYPGAAMLDDPEACLEDKDGDGWGDSTPTNLGVRPGRDCDDDSSTAEQTFPGAAEHERTEGQCMKDADMDGWGDKSPPDARIVPGSDCDEDGATKCVLVLSGIDERHVPFVEVFTDAEHSVDVVDAGALDDQSADGFTAVVVSPSTLWGADYDRILREMTTPVLVVGPHGHRLDLSVAPGFTNAVSAPRLDLIETNDPRLGGLTGSVRFDTQRQTIFRGQLVWSTSEIWGTVQRESESGEPQSAPAYYSFEKGAQLGAPGDDQSQSFVAPARRIGLGIVPNGSEPMEVSEDGQQLLLGAFEWLAVSPELEASTAE